MDKYSRKQVAIRAGELMDAADLPGAIDLLKSAAVRSEWYQLPQLTAMGWDEAAINAVRKKRSDHFIGLNRIRHEQKAGAASA